MPLCRQRLHDAADVDDKAHVEHAIRFIQHQHFQLAQGQGALGQQIQQTARGGDQNVHPQLDGVQIGLDADTAIGDQSLERQVVGILDDALAHLCRQFAGRGQYQCAHLTTATTVVGQQTLQHRQGETGRFACACLSAAEHILTGQNGRNRLLLDGGWLFVTQLLDGPQNMRRQTQFVE